MARNKKTIEVLPLVQWSNRQLARTDEYATVEFKMGICTSIEHVLMETGNYEGFSFRDNSDCEFGTPGYFNRQYHLMNCYAPSRSK